MSHITGGGLPGNLPRVLPEGLGLRIERLWARAPIFDLVQRAGQRGRGRDAPHVQRGGRVRLRRPRRRGRRAPKPRCERRARRPSSWAGWCVSRPTAPSRSAWSGRRDRAGCPRLRQRDQPPGHPRRDRGRARSRRASPSSSRTCPTPGRSSARATAGVETVVVDHRGFADRAAFDAAVLRVLRERGVELVVLAGFMRMLTPVLLDAFPMRVVNVHPALLPAFPGVRGQRQALEYGVRVAGCTVHFVDGGTDTGPIIAQAAVPVHDDDDEATLTRAHSRRRSTSSCRACSGGSPRAASPSRLGEQGTARAGASAYACNDKRARRYLVEAIVRSRLVMRRRHVQAL